MTRAWSSLDHGAADTLIDAHCDRREEICEGGPPSPLNPTPFLGTLEAILLCSFRCQGGEPGVDPTYPGQLGATQKNPPRSFGEARVPWAKGVLDDSPES